MTGILGKIFGTGKPTELTGRDQARLQSVVGSGYNQQTAGQGQTVTGQLKGWGYQPQPGTTYLPTSLTQPKEPFIQHPYYDKTQRLDPNTLAIILAAKDTIRDWVKDYFPALVYANVHNLKNVYNFNTISPRCDREMVFIMILNTITPEDAEYRGDINRLRMEYETILDLLYDSNRDFDKARGLISFTTVNRLRENPELKKMKEDYDNLSKLDEVV